MVSSLAHVWRGAADTFTVFAASSFAFWWLGRISTKPSFFLWVTIGITPLLLLPDYSLNLTDYVPDCMSFLKPVIENVTSTAGVVAVVSAYILVKLLRPKNKFDADFIVDESKCSNLKVVGNGLPSLDEVPQFVSEMRQCYNSGISRPLAKRKEQLLALRRLLVENEQDICEALNKDLGRPQFTGLFYDNFLPIAEIDELLKHLDEWTAPKPVGTHILSFPSCQYTQAEPLGVCLVIGTWNFPFFLTLAPLAGALAGGNTVVVKPCNVSKNCADLMAKLIPQYLDPRIVSVLGTNMQGDRTCTGKLLEQRFDHIFFTGSPTVGRVILKGAAQYLTPCTLELGGKNPVIVDKNCDIEQAARRTVWGRCINAGQQCISPDFVLCHRDVVDDFCKYAKKHIPLLYGDDIKNDGNVGRIVGEKQMERIAGLLETHNGQVVAGGSYDKGTRYVEPTVIRCDEASSLMDEEIFGPILAVLVVDSVEQAIDMVNAREKPLALYLYTNDKRVERQVIQNTSSGGITVNHCLFHVGHPGLPFGGVGNSGMGAYHGKRTFETFVHDKPILLKSKWPDAGAISDPFFVYPPWTGFKVTILRLLKPFL